MIYITHGVMPGWRPERISHALFNPEWLFALHLQNRLQKYVSLAEAVAGEGDALTIDDATYGGLRAALLAAKWGHAVSWFVNGLNVEQGLPYFPFQFSRMIDDTQRSDCEFKSRHWSLRSNMDRRAFRQHLKDQYMRMGTQGQIQDLLRQISSCLEVDSDGLEWALRTVGSQELSVASAAGVELQNHGWSHLSPSSLTETELAMEAALNEEYLSQFRQSGIRVYAPPFGRQVSFKPAVSDFVLLADRSVPSSCRVENVVNRADLRLNQFAISRPGQQIHSSLLPAG